MLFFFLKYKKYVMDNLFKNFLTDAVLIINSICYEVIQKLILFIHHMIVAGYYDIPSGVCLSIHPFVCPSVRTLFPENSSHSFHRMSLKLGRELDHKIV